MIWAKASTCKSQRRLIWTQVLSSSKRLLNPRQDFLPPGAEFALQAIGYALRDISEAFSAEWELSSLENTYMICWVYIRGSAGTLTLSLGSLLDAVSSSNLETLLSVSRRSREGVGSGRGYRMVSFQSVLVFKGYSFHIQFISVLGPASLQYYSPQPESQKADGTGGNCRLSGSDAASPLWVWMWEGFVLGEMLCKYRTLLYYYLRGRYRVAK